MGSGCNGNGFNGCIDITSDKCVKYTGEPIPALGICTGDTLFEIEAIILEKLQQYATGEGIILSDITAGCTFVSQFLANTDKSLHSLIQGLFDNQCTLRQLITDLQAGLEPPFVFDTKCLEVPTSPSRNQIIQANINKTCTLEEKINNIVDQLADINDQLGDDDGETNLPDAIADIVGNTLLNSVTACQRGIIRKTGAGKEAKLNFIGLPPPGTLLFGVFNITDFGPTGIGLEDRSMCGWHIANGWNNTVDMRGFTASGATNNIPGPPLQPSVQGLSATLGQRAGNVRITLNSSQLPDHEHEVTQAPHNHTYQGNDVGGHPAGSVNNEARGMMTKTTSSTTIDLQVQGLKGPSGEPIDVRQPTYYAMWIQRPMTVSLPPTTDIPGVNPGIVITP